MKTHLVAVVALACMFPACAQAHSPTEKQTEQKDALQRWVLDNVYAWHPWDAKKVAGVLGSYEKRPSPEKLVWDTYYFPKADMTILVSRQSNVEMIWRYGKVTQ